MRTTRSRWLPIIPLVLLISGILVIQGLPGEERASHIFIDDVSISVDGATVFQDDVRNETATEKWRTMEHAHTTDEAYNSPPSSLALRCAESKKAEHGTLHPRISIDPAWARLNITWAVKIPREALLGDETRHDLSLFFTEGGEGRSRLGCTIGLTEELSRISATAVYFGDHAPPIYDKEREIDFDHVRWHRVTLLLERQRARVCFDDEVVCDFAIHAGYLAEEIDLRWWAYWERT